MSGSQSGSLPDYSSDTDDIEVSGSRPGSSSDVEASSNGRCMQSGNHKRKRQRRRSRKTKRPKSQHAGRGVLKTNSSCPLPIELVRSSESDIHSSNSDPLGDGGSDEDDSDELEREDSGSSLSDMAQLVAQIKLMRKLEMQASARIAKEASRQEAMRVAEERRMKSAQMKLMEQEKWLKRIQKKRMEKELLAVLLLEVKRREEAANARILKAEKLNKDKEMQILQLLQDAILMQQETERLIQEKANEERLNKERELQLRRLELEQAEALKEPKDDMSLADVKCLPELSRVPGLVLQGSTLSEGLMVLQFLHTFGKVLGFDHLYDLDLSVLQEGLLNTGDSMGKVQDLLVCMVSSAIQDPGVPAGHRSKTWRGEHLSNVAINRDNVSEILQIYMEAHSVQTEADALGLSLRTKAFQSHSPSQKVCMFSFLVHALCCSTAVISEIDKNKCHMDNLWKDKLAVEDRLSKLRSIHTKRTEQRDSSVDGDDSLNFAYDKEEEDSWAELCEEEDDSVEELEKQIETFSKQRDQITKKLLHSHPQRSMMIGQDRYMRRYWLLPECGGVFVEGIESSKGYEELKETQETAQVTTINEEQPEENEILSKVADKAPSSKRRPSKRQKRSSAEIPSTAPYPSYPSSQTEISHSPPPATTLQGPAEETDTSGPYPLCSPQLKGSPCITSSPQPALQDDQLSQTLTNNSVNKLETPEALWDKPPCALFPAVEAAKTKDYPTPQPIPNEMLHGWWHVADMQQLHSLVEALSSRGIRESVLKYQIQQNMEYLTLLYGNSEDAFDVAKLEEVRETTVEGGMSQLQQVEALSRKEQSRTAGQRKRARAQPDSRGSCAKKSKLANDERH